jgi:hypothetical protein
VSGKPIYHGTCACGNPAKVGNRCRRCYHIHYDATHKEQRLRRLRGYVASPKKDVQRIDGRPLKWPQEVVRVAVPGWGVRCVEN